MRGTWCDHLLLYASVSRFDVLCTPRCFSAHEDRKECLFELQSVLAIHLWSLSSARTEPTDSPFNWTLTETLGLNLHNLMHCTDATCLADWLIAWMCKCTGVPISGRWVYLVYSVNRYQSSCCWPRFQFSLCCWVTGWVVGQWEETWGTQHCYWSYYMHDSGNRRRTGNELSKGKTLNINRLHICTHAHHIYTCTIVTHASEWPYSYRQQNTKPGQVRTCASRQCCMTGMSAVHSVPENSPVVDYAGSKWWSMPQLGLALVVRVWSVSNRGHAESGACSEDPTLDLHTWLPWEVRLEEIQEAAFSRPNSSCTIPLAHCIRA